MKVDAGYALARARRAVVAASGKQRVGEMVVDFLDSLEHQREIVFGHRTRSLMRTTIDGPANIVSMILRISGRAVYASSTAASLAVRTKQDAPGVRPRPAFDQSP